MKYLFKILILLPFISFQKCDEFDYKEPIDAKVDIKILKEKAIENATNRVQDVFDNINTNLNNQEKSIIKSLLFIKLRPEKIQFSLENLTISYNKTDNSYKPHYYLNVIKENPSFEDTIKQVTKEIFQSALHLKKQDDIYINKSTLEEDRFVKRLPLRGSDQITLINYVNPFNEDTNDFLKDDNIDVNLNFQDGNITIVFKKTYYHNWFHQNIVMEQFHHNNYSFDETTINLNLAPIIKIPLDQLINKNKIKEDEQFKIADTNNISYGNFFYHLLNNDLDPILSILNAIPNQNASFMFTHISNINFNISIDGQKIMLTFTRDKNKILSDFLKLDLDPQQFIFYGQNHYQATLKLNNMNDHPVLSDQNIISLIEKNPEIKAKEAGQQNLTYGNFFYYLLKGDINEIRIPLDSQLLTAERITKQKFAFTHVDNGKLSYVGKITITLTRNNNAITELLNEIPNITTNHFFRKKSTYDLLKNYINLPTDHLNTTNGKEMAGHGLAVLNAGVTLDKPNTQLQGLTQLETNVHTELKNGIDYYENGITPPEVGSFLHTLIHNTILKTVEVKVLGASLGADFASNVASVEANIKKIYLMNNRLIITLHASDATMNIIEWLNVNNSFITNAPEQIVVGTFSNTGYIQELANGVIDYTGDFSEKITSASVGQSITRFFTNNVFIANGSKIIRFRIRNILIGTVSRSTSLNLVSSYKNLLNKLIVFDDYFFKTNNIFGSTPQESFTNLKKISNSLAQFYLFRNFTQEIPNDLDGFEFVQVRIIKVLQPGVVLTQRDDFSVNTSTFMWTSHYLSTNVDNNPTTTQDLTIGITSDLHF